MPYPIMFKSRRRYIQRFLKLPILNIEKLWFPLIKYILRTQFKKKQELKVAIDRTQWRDKNVLIISLIWDKRALPLYWQILPKRGCSNLPEQQSLISPIISLLKNYKFVLLGDRDMVRVKLASWLCKKNIRFVLTGLKQSSSPNKPQISTYVEQIRYDSLGAKRQIGKI